jgi:hypothetical protein
MTDGQLVEHISALLRVAHQILPHVPAREQGAIVETIDAMWRTSKSGSPAKRLCVHALHKWLCAPGAAVHACEAKARATSAEARSAAEAAATAEAEVVRAVNGVSVLLFTVTSHVNRAHNLTRSP